MRSRTVLQFVAALCITGCASMVPPPPAPKPEAPVAVPATPPVPATQPVPATPPAPVQPSSQVQPAAPPSPPVKSSAAPPAATPKPKPPTPVATQAPITPPKPAPTAATTTTAAPPPAAPTLDLTSLEQRLRDTKAIGVFTKLSLKNQVDDLLGDFRALYKRAKPPPGPEFRQRYDLLLLKVLSLLQDGDPPLAAAISSSKEAIWNILADPDKLAKI
jgi:hypothetical protein